MYFFMANGNGVWSQMYPVITGIRDVMMTGNVLYMAAVCESISQIYIDPDS